MNNKLHIKTGDTVMIISGNDKGEKGKVLAVSPKEGKVIVEGRNIVKKHVKPRKMGDQGGIVSAEGALYASKVMVVCPHCNKPTRRRPQKVRRRVQRAHLQALRRNAVRRDKTWLE